MTANRIWIFAAVIGIAAVLGLGYVLGVGLSLCFFIHMANGIRHWFMDAGALFELRANKTSALVVILFGVIATAAYWAWLIWGK